MKYTKPNDSSRKGDMAEFYAVTWLWDNGYEVFKNCGCTGPVDLIARDKDGNISLIDVKCAQPQLHKETGNNVTKSGSRSKEQVNMGVKILQFNSKTRKLRFINHTS
jgi:Holliday junction resolvase-like predicted endonuclease|tara:strand:- start:42 stop:362 length:321 start_codon:yes stop_codon:yes gene_type:complete